MKKLITIMAAIIMSVMLSTPALAYNYQYESGADTKETFGTPTQTDEQPYNPELENVRRNKDASFIPPSYGVYSGNIPTDPSSPYHDNSRNGQASNVTNSTAIGGNSSTAGPMYDGTLTATGSVMSDSGMLVSTSIISTTETINTSPLYNNDGSIGTLKIPKLNQTIKIYEGETLDNMKVGAGHFEFTSVWDGNVGIAAHNRGSSGYFEGVKNLKNGDKVIYTTQYGTREYEVFSKQKISDTDYSSLGWTSENILTLITCVENSSSERWSVQCREVK